MCISGLIISIMWFRKLENFSVLLVLQTKIWSLITRILASVLSNGNDATNIAIAITVYNCY